MTPAEQARAILTEWTSKRGDLANWLIERLKPETWRDLEARIAAALAAEARTAHNDADNQRQGLELHVDSLTETLAAQAAQMRALRQSLDERDACHARLITVLSRVPDDDDDGVVLLRDTLRAALASAPEGPT